MPLHHSKHINIPEITARAPQPQKMELDKRVLIQIATELKERDNQLEELKFLNDEMRKGYEQQIALLSTLKEKEKSQVDQQQIKALIEAKQNEIERLSQQKEATNIEVIATQSKMRIDGEEQKQKNGLRKSVPTKGVVASTKKTWK